MTNLLKNQKLNSIISTSKSVYLCIFTVYLIVRLVPALHFYIDSLLISGFFFGMAALYIGYDILTNRFCLKTRYFSALILFLTITIISCIVNLEYGFFSNVKGVAGFAIYLFLIYPESFNTKSKAMEVISYTACFTLCVFSLVSLPMYFYNVYYFIENHSWQGFLPLHDRLWGIYQEPGYASLYASIAICLSILLFKKTKSIILKIALIFCDLIQIIYISLGGSRMAILASIVALIWVSFIIVFKKINVKVIYKILIFMLCIVIAIITPLSIVKGVQTGLPLIKRAILNNGTPETYITVHKIYDEFYKAGRLDIALGFADEIVIEDYPFEETTQTVDRSDNPTEISNGRFDRWIDGILVLIKSPLFGTSPRNIVSFAKDFASDTLMGKYEYSIHNSYLEMLTGVGILAGIVVLSFLVLAAIYVIKLAFNMSSDINNIIYSTIVLLIAFSAILLPDILFFQLTFPGMLFWLCLGNCLNSDPQNFQQSLTCKTFNKLFKKGN